MTEPVINPLGARTQRSNRQPGVLRRIRLRDAVAVVTGGVLAAGGLVAVVAAPALAATTWSTPVELSATGQNASAPQVASSADGTRLSAVWLRYNGSNTIVQAAASTDSGTTWGTPVDLSATGQDAFGPQVASSTDGTKLSAVWERYNGSHTIVQAAASTDSGATWGTPVDLSATGQSAYGPQFTSSADGTRLSAVWYRNNGSNWIIQAASSTDSGTTWGTPVDLSAAGGDATAPQVASSADGTRLSAVWFRDNGSNNIIQAASGTVPIPGPLSFSSGAFPAASVGVAAPLSVTVTNAGTAAATPSAITPAGADVAVTGGTCASGTAIGASVSCTVTLAWTPAASGALAGGLLTVAYPGGASASDTVALTGTATAAGGSAQTPQGDCVIIGGRIPRRGTKSLETPGCVTNADQRVGVTVRAAQRLSTRGDVRFYSLFCQVSKKKTTVTKATGYADGSRYCKKGALKIRTYGVRLGIRITWTAPATGTYAAYTNTKTYTT